MQAVLRRDGVLVELVPLLEPSRVLGTSRPQVRHDGLELGRVDLRGEGSPAVVLSEEHDEVRSGCHRTATVDLCEAHVHRLLVHRRFLAHAPTQVDGLEPSIVVATQSARLGEDPALQDVSLGAQIVERGADEHPERPRRTPTDGGGRRGGRGSDDRLGGRLGRARGGQARRCHQVEDDRGHVLCAHHRPTRRRSSRAGAVHELVTGQCCTLVACVDPLTGCRADLGRRSVGDPRDEGEASDAASTTAQWCAPAPPTRGVTRAVSAPRSCSAPRLSGATRSGSLGAGVTAGAGGEEGVSAGAGRSSTRSGWDAPAASRSAAARSSGFTTAWPSDAARRPTGRAPRRR